MNVARRMSRFAAALLCAGLITACSPGAEGDGGAELAISDVEHVQVGVPEAEALDAVVNNCNSMGLTSLSGEDNVVFSPLSWCMALGMLAPGTSNDARTEVTQALGAEPGDAVRALNALAGVLASHEGDPASVDEDNLPEEPIVHRASRVVVRQDFEPEAPYLDAIKENFDAGVLLADLSSPEVAEVLDAWVNEHTGGRIKESAIEPDENLLLALQDALLFAASWQQPFTPREAVDFTGASGTPVEVAGFGAMREADFAEFDGWSAARIPFTSDFSAMFILPPQAGGDLTAEVKEGLHAVLSERMVDFQSPTLALNSTVDLRALLDAHGIPSLADPATSPLEGIAPQSDLHVAQAVQQATLDVTELGAVAAAVTEIGAGATSAPAPDAELILDRPFFLVISHDDTSIDLFQAAIRELG